jgi:DNA-binding MarR family transcriptional regulator
MSMNASEVDIDLVASWKSIAVGFARTQERLLKPIDDAGIAEASFQALRLLLESDDHRMPMSRLARDLGMTAGGLTKLADRLARDGLIDRRNSSADRRVVYAALTDKGADLAASTLEMFRAGLREHVLSVISPAQLVELAEAFEALGAVHAVSDANDEAVLTARDPALPERRGRGRDTN